MDGVFLLLGGEVCAHQRLRQLGALPLGEVDHVHGHLARAHQLVERLVQGLLFVVVVERHRALLRAHHADLAASHLFDAFDDGAQSPSVALISRNRTSLSTSRGICQAMPRSGSP